MSSPCRLCLSVVTSMPVDAAGSHRVWNFGETSWLPRELPRLMGILNVTPDSFSDGGLYGTESAAVEQGLRLAQAGADMIDVGGESTRPGAVPVSVDEELRRVLPVIETLSERLKREGFSVPISIDTMKAGVARQAIAAGATVVNDVSAGTFDPAMTDVWRESTCGIMLMHMQGSPQTMQTAPHYDDVVREVVEYLEQRLQSLASEGIDATRVVLDPGIGFGKTAEHNRLLLTNIATLHELGRPVLIGHSRKRFLYSLLGRETDERLAGTIGVSIALAMQSTDILRVHDVSQVRDALRTWQALAPHPQSAPRFPTACESRLE
ncbi:MAG: dihydropteroate synthase [Planctomycetaceae bacterium]